MCCGEGPPVLLPSPARKNGGLLGRRRAKGSCGGYREELPSGHVFCTRLHLLGDCLEAGSRWFIQHGGAGLGKLAFFPSWESEGGS